MPITISEEVKRRMHEAADKAEREWRAENGAAFDKAIRQQMDSPPCGEERGLVWAVLALEAGALVRHKKWEPGAYWEKLSGIVQRVDAAGIAEPENLLHRYLEIRGFELFEVPVQQAASAEYREVRAQETRDEPITRKQLVDAVTQCRNECAAHASGEFRALSGRLTEISSRLRALEPKGLNRQ